ncbi:hypothetical protein YC2023_023696 [Brassica napus]
MLVHVLRLRGAEVIALGRMFERSRGTEISVLGRVFSGRGTETFVLGRFVCGDCGGTEWTTVLTALVEHRVCFMLELGLHFSSAMNSVSGLRFSIPIPHWAIPLSLTPPSFPFQVRPMGRSDYTGTVLLGFYYYRALDFYPFYRFIAFGPLDSCYRYWAFRPCDINDEDRRPNKTFDSFRKLSTVLKV